MSSLIARKRADFHHRLIESGTLAISPSGVASNADRSQQFSQRVALSVARALGAREGGAKLDGQRAGKNFEEAVSRFVADTFALLSALRPGPQPDRVVLPDHSPTTSYCVVTARPPVSICPAMSDSPSLSSVDSIGE